MADQDTFDAIRKRLLRHSDASRADLTSNLAPPAPASPLVTLLRIVRAEGADARVTVKARFADAGSRPAVLAFLGIAEGTLTADEFNACVDTAMLQL